jgi:anti-anti-sigma factor
MQSTLIRSNVALVQPSGHVNAASAIEFQRQLTAAITGDEGSILLVDMEQVESLDSAGLMALVSALRQAHHLGRRFSLCSVSPAIRIIFDLTELDKAFEIFESRAAFELATGARV